ncbi:MAG: elastin (supravalvular aortic stenosis, Williams-Beuren syndrome)-like protein [Myxococcales bacterium]|nr:elastin (supravalvular aortic stenosis, Williams-Beuren syndrome)-like protein [Myxococcales bacterium]
MKAVAALAARLPGPSLSDVCVLCAFAANLSLLATPAFADRPWHGSVGAGTTLLLTGDRGDRNRYELEVDVEPASRFGALLAWRGFDHDHHGLACAGLVYEAGAARPRIVVDLHGDIGVDLDQRAPLLGGGIRTTIAVVGPLGVALDSGAYLVIDGVESTRLALAAGAMLVARW